MRAKFALRHIKTKRNIKFQNVDINALFVSRKRALYKLEYGMRIGEKESSTEKADNNTDRIRSFDIRNRKQVSENDFCVLNRYEYDAFGKTTKCEETVENRFRFAGEQYDLLMQQYYLRARFYNPVIGCFIQEDNYYGDGLNLYAYCRNNPLAYVDPSGHGTESVSDKENQPWDEDYEKFYKDMYNNQRDGNEQYEDYVEDLRNLEGTDPSDATMAKEFEDEYGIDGDKQGINDGQDSSKSGTDSIGNIGNPSNNPKVLADAMDDYAAVYGYRQREDGSIKQFANYAWSDPKVVAELREIRLDYLQENRSYQNMVDNMRNAGCSDTEIAQRLVAERNAHRLSYYVDETGKIIDEDLYR